MALGRRSRILTRDKRAGHGWCPSSPASSCSFLAYSPPIPAIFFQVSNDPWCPLCHCLDWWDPKPLHTFPLLKSCSSLRSRLKYQFITKALPDLPDHSRSLGKIVTDPGNLSFTLFRSGQVILPSSWTDLLCLPPTLSSRRVSSVKTARQCIPHA